MPTTIPNLALCAGLVLAGVGLGNLGRAEAAPAAPPAAPAVSMEVPRTKPAPAEGHGTGSAMATEEEMQVRLLATVAVLASTIDPAPAGPP